ncbi:Transmembrane 9 super member 2 [Coemansia spiralis]|uniref:Transmembrane 9 superfamily member n=2 Tax=Coemansia TaxID=4863 RepID=A0A9W8G6L1_9FUNG|nr:Nonaspanin TM9SF [Coemansia spiralis]KAJ1990285.1 Transmembrane 9 super member 2 [Coemansia umbellata]KAJ2619257.1 Transmembrane 9 super member 2 [Coemansia sp. RSA 1358]KAJ2674174.1 Transmembrane 9 super member 2 [Coemansia spiralis]
MKLGEAAKCWKAIALSLGLGVLTLGRQASGFYLPGIAPHDYMASEKVDLLVNSFTPSLNAENKLESVLSYSYYDDRFHFCKPNNGLTPAHESLGSILFGDRIYGSPFELHMLNNVSCELLCQQTIPGKDVAFINDKILKGYNYNWLIDGLPAATVKIDDRTQQQFYSIGFELGSASQPGQLVPHFHNHYEITVQYHTVDAIHHRVVGVIITPMSKNTVMPKDFSLKPNCDVVEPMNLQEEKDNNVVFTYSVRWVRSDKSWATRWDAYLNAMDPKIHWFSLINSAVIVIFLSAMLALILIRALHKDIARYNADDAEDLQEDFGWKLVHGDVFRAPQHFEFLAVILGSGYQLFWMMLTTLIVAILGFISPSSRGSLASAMLILFILFGFSAGFNSAHMYHSYGGTSLKRIIIMTVLFVPGTCWVILMIINFCLIAAHSSAAAPAHTLLGVMALWFTVSIPLTIAGAYYGYHRKTIDPPVRVNQIPRQIPDQPWYLRPVPAALMGGILTFGAIFIELYFIMNSIWFHKVYYVFGFLFLVFVILVVTTAEVTILLTYFHLCAEDYNWQWRSVYTAGASALYVFLYGVLFYFSRLRLASYASLVIYFGWMIIACLLLFILTGSIGFVASHYFVRRIYGAIKID